MRRELRFRGVRLRREGFAGVRVSWGGLEVCVDCPEPGGGYALYTHPHPRHFPGLERLGGATIVSPWLGLRVRPGDRVELAGAVVEVVEAYNRPEHGGPHPRGLGVGYVLDLGGVRVYHMGDTDLIDEVLEVAGRGVDVLLAPVGGGSVMTPEEAREAVRSLRPALTVPIHCEDPRRLFSFRDMVQPYTQVVILG